MVRQQPLRQRIRKGVILTTFLLFPIIMNYFSPYVIIDGASQGIVNGSFIVFGLMFLSLPGPRPRVVRLGLPGRRTAGGRVRRQQRPVQDRQARLDQVVHLGAVDRRHRGGRGFGRRLPAGGLLPPDRERRLGDRADAVHHLPDSSWASSSAWRCWRAAAPAVTPSAGWRRS